MTRDATADGPLVVYGANPVLELVRSGHAVRRLHVGAGTRLSALVDAARARGIAVVETGRDELARLARSPHHQGAVAEAAGFAYARFETLLRADAGMPLLLDGVQDPRNLGAILRTARAAGVAGVVLPKDRSVGVTSAVVAASAGTVFGLPVCRVPNLVRAMEALKEAGGWLVGLAADGETELFALDPPPRPALIVGGEGEGLRALVRKTCDWVVALPMATGVESLNVSVAAGIALYVLRHALRPRA